MKLGKSKSKRRTSAAVEGCYTYNHNSNVHLILEQGEFQWGFVSGTYEVIKSDDRSVMLAFASGFYEQRKHPKKYRLTRRGNTYVFTDQLNGSEDVFVRSDQKLFLTDSLLRSKQPPKKPLSRPTITKNGAADFRAFLFAAQPEWSLWAVEASLDSVATTFAALQHGKVWARDIHATPPKKKGVVLANMVVIVQIKNSVWVVGLRTVG